MIGPMSSSLALAQRTATKARATMDTMARQIATGQKVSSVKDNGAVWARASAMKSEKVTWEQAKTWADVRVSISNHRQTVAEHEVNEINKPLLSTLLAMTQEGLSATSFSALRDEANALMASMGNAWNEQYIGASGSIYAVGIPGYPELTATIQLPNGTASYSDYNGGIWQFADTYTQAPYFDGTNTGGRLRFTGPGWDIALPDRAAAIQAFGYMQEANDRWTRAVASHAAGLRKFEDWSDRASVNIDRLDSAIGSLTDADLGKVSTARSQAETRQQLALSTIQQAISAYGNFAGGLLGNVQRTQRGVLA
jgi:flagellin